LHGLVSRQAQMVANSGDTHIRRLIIHGDDLVGLTLLRTG
jgi:hypothetical protein